MICAKRKQKTPQVFEAKRRQGPSTIETRYQGPVKKREVNGPPKGVELWNFEPRCEVKL